MLFIVLFMFFGLIAAAVIKDLCAQPEKDMKRAMREHRVGKVGNPFEES